MAAAGNIRGLGLSESYYSDIVRPILDEYFPGLAHSCGLLGPGSEVLGFDDEMSQDHQWGPRLILFLAEDDYANLSAAIDRSLRQHLPTSCLGYSTNFSPADGDDVRLMAPASTDVVDHLIELVTIQGYFEAQLGVDVYDDLSPVDWLSFPQHVLLSIRSGRIFHDALGLVNVRQILNYYPHDVWLYMMASSWQRIGQEEHLAARAWLTGQDIGFSIIASRLVKDCMQLAFLLERQYAPYAKWLEKAFSNLDCAPVLRPCLEKITGAADLKSRQEHLCRAFEILASMHNDLSPTIPIPAECRAWHNRPFTAIHGGEIAGIIAESIAGNEMRSIAAKGLTGNIDQISDNTDVLENRVVRRQIIRALYGGGEEDRS